MKSLKIFVGVAAVAVLAVALAPVAEAQCPSARIFASVGGMMETNLRVQPTAPVDTNGNEVGRFWDSGGSNLSNNFGGSCPSSIWWGYNAAGNGQIDGALTEGACAQSGCPGSEMTLVVENYDAGGPPGVGGDAFFVAFRVDETPGAFRWYDFGRSDGRVGGLVPWLPFPDVQVTSSSRLPNDDVEISATLVDVAGNTHGAIGATDMQPAASAMVNEYQLLRATGMTDPGRSRTLWTPIATFPYNDSGATVGPLTIPCDDTVNDTWLAVGIGFNGGSAGNVDSELVGRAIQVECNPTLADPNGIQTLQPKRPSTIQKDSSSGGRR